MSYNLQTPSGKDPELWELAKRRADFKKHFPAYLVMSVFFWVLWFVTGNRFHHGGVPWPVWPMLGWGIGVVFHYMSAYGALQDDSAEREYQKLRDKQSNKN